MEQQEMKEEALEIDGDEAYRSSNVWKQIFDDKRKSGSICWKFMIFHEDKGRAQCKLCHNQLRCAGKTSTSNLTRHLQAKHPLEMKSEKVKSYAKNGIQVPVTPIVSMSNRGYPATSSTSSLSKTEMVKPTSAQFESESTMYNSDPQRKKLLDGSILNFVIKNMQPLSIVETDGFQQLVCDLDPKYEMVSQNLLTTRLLTTKYEQVKQKVVEEMKDCSHVSITTDNWTSCTKDAYTTITANFIDSNWKLQSRTLYTISVSEGNRHASENLLLGLHEVCREFGLINKVSTIVTDNTENITNSAVVLKIEPQLCFAHILNLVVSKAIESVSQISILVKKVMAIVSHLHTNTVATNTLRHIHRQKGTRMKKLKQKEDVETCWSSTFDMLQSFISQYDEVTTVLCLTDKKNLCLDDQDISAVKDTVVILEPFYEAMVELSTENSRASKIIPMVKVLTKLTGRLDRPLGQQLHDNLKDMFDGIEQKSHLALATLLDPRFKKNGFSSYQRADRAVDELKKAMIVDSVKMAEKHEDDEEDDDVPPPAKKTSLLWSGFDSDLHLEVSEMQEDTTKILTHAEEEIQRYLESPSLEIRQDPLLWWKDFSRTKTLPQLDKIAKGVLSIPATSFPHEGIVSKARVLVSAKHVDMMIFLNKNM